MLTTPDDEILTRFEVRVVAPLGGRVNQHWLVKKQDAPFVLRRWAQSLDEVEYETRLLARVAALGWPVPVIIEGPVSDDDGFLWSLSPFLPGDPPPSDNPENEQRARGRLLATFHADMEKLGAFGQRPNWRRCEEILGDTTLDDVLTRHEPTRPEEVRLLRWHLDRARARIADLALPTRPGCIVHGDFTPWNLRFTQGRLSGLLDFELAHHDHRVADFALSWRGKYDAVVHGYHDVSPLEPGEWALLTPLWWAQLIQGACRDLQSDLGDDGWTIKKLLQRSPLMGPDAAEFP